MMLENLRKLFKSGAVGLLATAVDLLALAALVEGLGWEPWQANVPALGLGVLVQFVGNKYVAFGDRSREWLRQGGQFALVESGAVVLNAALFHLAVTALTLPYGAARVGASLLIYFGFSYPLWTRIFAPARVE